MDKAHDIRLQRWKLLVHLKEFLEVPMVVLGFVWLVLIIIDLTRGLPPAGQKVSMIIWGFFILEFVLSFVLAPKKGVFLKKNIITLISLVVPAFRVLRIFRAVRALRLVKVLGSVNRGMRGLLLTMKHGGFGYMIALTVIVLFSGAAGMYAFEKDVNPRLNSFHESLWWTAMMLLTVGSEYWPKSTEGRILCYIIALFGFAVLGYITATMATFLLGRSAAAGTQPPRKNELPELKREIAELKDMLRQYMDNKK